MQIIKLIDTHVTVWLFYDNFFATISNYVANSMDKISFCSCTTHTGEDVKILLQRQKI